MVLDALPEGLGPPALSGGAFGANRSSGAASMIGNVVSSRLDDTGRRGHRCRRQAITGGTSDTSMTAYRHHLQKQGDQ